MDQYDDTVAIPLVWKQARLFEPAVDDTAASQTQRFFSAPAIDIHSYDRIVVCMSGGKDSIAALLHLFDIGAECSRIELWHHDVDGREGSHLMDWPFMADYVRKLAHTFGLPLYFSWLDGGFEGELQKNNAYGRPHKIETPNGLMVLERDTRRSAPATRMRFPQQSASLQTRWCSSALKIDVGRRAITNQPRFDHSRTLFVTGERREESPNRAKYYQLEAHVCDRRHGVKARHVDAWRPVLEWRESEVWACLQRHQVLAPVPYRLSFSRSSCQGCIFNSPRIWATIGKYFPDRLATIAGYEMRFGTTISRERVSVTEIAASATPFVIDDEEALDQAGRTTYTLPVTARAETPWLLPAGAYANHQSGPV